MSYCTECGTQGFGSFCSECGEQLERGSTQKHERWTGYAVILRRVPYVGRWVRRDTLLARDMTKEAAEKLAAEYRGTGWSADVISGAIPTTVYVPTPRAA